MKTKMCTLMVAVIMLFSFVCNAENGYVTISDPYYTDGTNVYDLTGLSFNVSYARAEMISQLILRAVTSTGAVAGGIETDGETVSLYADGFSSKYTMSLEDLMLLIGEAIDGNQNFIEILSVDQNAQAPSEITLSDLVSGIYDDLYADGSKLTNAKIATVDTFLHAGMSAFSVPLDMSSEEIESAILPILSALDGQKSLLTILNRYAASDPYADENGEIFYEPVTFVSFYENEIKPLNLNVKGNAYYGENEIFIEWNLLKGEDVILPAFLEVTNTENPSLYVNVLLNNGAYVFYATIEASENGLNDYLEMGVLEGERTAALMTYQVYMNENIPVQDLYIGVTSGNELYNFSIVNATDSETTRDIHVIAYLDGIEAQLSYTGAITSDYGDINEQGVLQLATNIGMMARVNVGFGRGSGEPAAFIPEDIPGKEIVSMTDEENERMMIDFSNLLETLKNTLIMGVPGIAQILGMENAQG